MDKTERIEMHKTYVTRGGRPARVLCVDASEPFPVVVLVGEHLYRTLADGRKTGASTQWPLQFQWDIFPAPVPSSAFDAIKWTARYYSISAQESCGDAVQAARHSLRKWWGVRQALRHPSVYVEGSMPPLLRTSDWTFPLDAGSCALCWRYDVHGRCSECSLAVVELPPSGSLCGTGCKLDGSTYAYFCKTGDTRPLIRALIKAVRLEIKRCGGL